MIISFGFLLGYFSFISLFFSFFREGQRKLVRVEAKDGTFLISFHFLFISFFIRQ